MKTTLKRKTILAALMLTAGLSIGLYSCKKDNSSTSDTVTEADAVELTTDAVVSSTGGFSVQVNSSATVYKSSVLKCGVEKDSTITKTSVAGATPSYNYSLKWAYVLNCSSSALTATLTGTSNYNGLSMSSTDNSSGSFALSGLQLSSSAYTLNSTYTRNGSQTSKIGRNYSFTSNLTITSSNIMVDKTTLLILSGSATVAISGTSSGGSSFTYNGTITFLGGNKATLVLNSGTTYNIQW